MMPTEGPTADEIMKQLSNESDDDLIAEIGAWLFVGTAAISLVTSLEILRRLLRRRR